MRGSFDISVQAIASVITESLDLKETKGALFNGAVKVGSAIKAQFELEM